MGRVSHLSLFCRSAIDRLCNLYLIGIGLELVRQQIDRGNYVIAAVRDTTKCLELLEISARADPDQLQITEVKIAEEESVKHWASDLKTRKISHINVLWNNAGTGGDGSGVLGATKGHM